VLLSSFPQCRPCQPSVRRSHAVALRVRPPLLAVEVAAARAAPIGVVRAAGTARAQDLKGRIEVEILFPVTCLGSILSDGGLVGCGVARYRAAASGATSPGTGSTGSWSAGSQSLAFSILILCSALTPVTRGGSRMRRSARTDLCGGRSAMIVPTATAKRIRLRTVSALPLTAAAWTCWRWPILGESGSLKLAKDRRSVWQVASLGPFRGTRLRVSAEGCAFG
jgi:hypothetical protein